MVPELLGEDTVKSFNRAIAQSAANEIYGAHKLLVEEFWKTRGAWDIEQPSLPDANLLTTGGVKRSALLVEFFEFLKFLEVPDEILKQATGGKICIPVNYDF